MDRMMYTAMTGAKQIVLQQASNNHNLANVSTAGFKQDYDVFRSLPLNGPGYPTRVFTEETRAGIDFKPGSLLSTGRDLDVSVNGSGFIAIQAEDGSEVLTRAGDFKINAAGVLETGAGHFVLGGGGPIAIPPFEKLEIGSDGTVSILPLGQAESTLLIVDRIKLVNPPVNELMKRADGLIQSNTGQPLPADADVRVTAGALEASNVNAVDALINMIQLSRQFEMNIKMMEQADSTDRASATLMRINQ